MKFIDKKYNCELHGEVDYTARIVFEVVERSEEGEQWDDVDKTKPYCPICAKQKQDEEETQKRKEEEKQRIELMRVRRHSELALPLRFASNTFSSYKPINKAAERNYQTCKSYADNFQYVFEEGKSLLMLGSLGTGKSHLASAIGYQLAEDGYQPHYTTLQNILESVKATWSSTATRMVYKDCHSVEVKITSQDVIERYVSYDLLIIDEILSVLNENDRNLIFNIIDERYQNMKPTIVISNFTEKELAKIISERSVSRLKQGSGTLIFNWEDYRAKAA
ncbi:MAG: DNA replication protein DnaC [Glaciecola sp.]|jgi:DNA replication protein DnaC